MSCWTVGSEGDLTKVYAVKPIGRSAENGLTESTSETNSLASCSGMSTIIAACGDGVAYAWDKETGATTAHFAAKSSSYLHCVVVLDTHTFVTVRREHSHLFRVSMIHV